MIARQDFVSQMCAVFRELRCVEWSGRVGESSHDSASCTY